MSFPSGISQWTVNYNWENFLDFWWWLTIPDIIKVPKVFTVSEYLTVRCQYLIFLHLIGSLMFVNGKAAWVNINFFYHSFPTKIALNSECAGLLDLIIELPPPPKHCLLNSRSLVHINTLEFLKKFLAMYCTFLVSFFYTILFLQNIPRCFCYWNILFFFW